MNNKGKYYYDNALKTTVQFGTRHKPNCIVIRGASISKRNFSGNADRFGNTKRIFWINLTEDLFNAIVAEKGNCNYSVWEFAAPEDTEPKLYQIKVQVNYASANQPKAFLYTRANKDADYLKETELTDVTIGSLDHLYDEDIENIDLYLNPYDRKKDGNFTLYLNRIEVTMKYIEEDESYVKKFKIVRDEDNAVGDTNED